MKLNDPAQNAPGAGDEDADKRSHPAGRFVLWGGRFEEAPSEVFERFSGSLHFDRRLIDADIRGSQAFARALESVGILTASERIDLVSAFDAIHEASRD